MSLTFGCRTAAQIAAGPHAPLPAAPIEPLTRSRRTPGTDGGIRLRAWSRRVSGAMTDRGLDHLAAAYVELVALQGRGALEEARALHHRIAHEIRTAISTSWAEGQRRLALGDHHGALSSFESVLHVQRQDLLSTDHKTVRTACFVEIARVLTAMGQPIAATAAAAIAAQDGGGFYQPAASCQIPVLGGLYSILFGDRPDGSFVDVGAYDGESFSNTSCLADLGWRGLMIEPVEASFAKCRERHAANARVALLNCAIGPTDGVIRFWENAAFSTGSAAEMAVNRINDWTHATTREVTVRQRRLDEVLTEAGIGPGFDLLSIDVDGMEEQVFESFALAHWRPRCLIVELIDENPGFVGHDQLIQASSRVRALIERHGYETVYRDRANTVFRQRATA